MYVYLPRSSPIHDVDQDPGEFVLPCGSQVGTQRLADTEVVLGKVLGKVLVLFGGQDTRGQEPCFQPDRHRVAGLVAIVTTRCR